ncbi:putative F-box associated interaction domain-containing protein [Rosa chinensis]|uniref:Putative F-box associated interaction domain-containing protein n=1 Tax=Rosa chinensis TaxID=74649 RepID=A0A2P6PYM3_ROSCH|nr:putative F-box protein At3g16210 [Rosa chinensis]PRQ27009.1 putative F-box associated interaction domain-containing protein [Rosa chinensis]
MSFAQKVMVLTVGSGSWRSIWYPGYHSEQENGIYVNGYLHWIGQCGKGSLVIHSFNLESESYEQLPMPPCCFDPHKAQLNLGVFNGCLSITVRSSYYIRIWVMKNYGVKEYSWTREVDIREILGGLVKRSCDYPTRVLEYTKERQVLVLDNRLQSYSTPNEGFVKNEVDGIENIHDAAYVHIQSFVLLKDLIRGSSIYVQRFRHDKKSGKLVAHNPRG